MCKRVIKSEAFDLIVAYFYHSTAGCIGAKKIGYRTYIFYRKNTLLYRLILMLDLDDQEDLYRLVTSDGSLDGVSL
jgi:hypothetical protein